MEKIHTHYDNLKVARNAPPEVIKAAYRILSQKYHPDKNPGSKDAERVMALLNTSYEVLSDPVKRKEHDLWIEQKEFAAFKEAQQRASSPPPAPASAQSPPQAPAASGKDTGGLLQHITKNWYWYGISGVAFFLIAEHDKSQRQSSSYNPSAAYYPPATYQPAPVKTSNPVYQPSKPPNPPSKTKYARPLAAPNGSAWPTNASYVHGYKQLNTTGLSELTVDNSRNDSDVFVKLYYLDGPKPYPARHFYIPAFRSFTVKQVQQGNYDVRYKDLDSGALSRSEPFKLKETFVQDGIRYSTITMTLYKVRDGNMQTYSLPEEDF